MNKAVVWFTGLPCSGKTTLAEDLVGQLKLHGEKPVHLDGDLIRGMIGGAGFSREDRDRHIRYVACMSRVLKDNGHIVVASFVSPFESARQFVRELCQNVLVVYISTPASVCEARDVKGLWAKARRGEIQNFTGLDGPYEIPEDPDIILDTSIASVQECVDAITIQLMGRIN